MPNIHDLSVDTLAGAPSTLGDIVGNRVALLVNVASKCGLTPQYATLEALQLELGGDAFTVVGFPCNQFGGQEPGTADEIAEFCSATYGVTFPMTAKVDVNGAGRHPVYDVLTQEPAADGTAGDIQWNFEKFVIGADGAVLGRFRPKTEPDAPEIRAAIESGLAARG